MKGTLLLAHGAPHSLEDIPSFLAKIRNNRPFSQEFLEEVKSRYIQIGGKSPLSSITQSLAEKLGNRLQHPVLIGMKYAEPSISAAIDQARSFNITELNAICLAPHYSTLSIGGYERQLTKALENAEQLYNYKPKLRFTPSWHLQPLYLSAWAKRIRPLLQPHSYLLFTAHSLPASILSRGDPYVHQLSDTSKAIAHLLGWPEDRFSLAFQSEAQTGEPWLSPTAENKLRSLSEGAYSHVVIAPIGFVADHVEILYDIDIVFQKEAKALQLELVRPSSLNDSDDLVEVLSCLLK